MITSEDMIRFAITITPTILTIIYNWYASRRKKGKILIHTEDATIELNAESIKEFKFTEKKSRKKSRKKRRNSK